MTATTSTQKVPCSICGCSTLPRTAGSTGGVCRPCDYQIAGHVRVKFRLPRVPALSYDNNTIVAERARMRGVLALVNLVAESDLPVLISREAATGKASRARDPPAESAERQAFVRQGLHSLPDGLIVSSFFGRAGDYVGGLASVRKNCARGVPVFPVLSRPRDISELQAVLELCVVPHRGDTVRMEHLPPEMTGIHWASVLPR